MNHFEQAVQEIPDREQEYKKLAYYRAGKLAMGLKDLAKAEKYLTTLASMDYTYRDMSDLLERLHRMQEEENRRQKGEARTKKEDARKTEGRGRRTRVKVSRFLSRIFFRFSGSAPLDKLAGFRQNG